MSDVNYTTVPAYQIMPMRYGAQGTYEVRRMIGVDRWVIVQDYLSITEARALVATLGALAPDVAADLDDAILGISNTPIAPFLGAVAA